MSPDANDPAINLRWQQEDLFTPITLAKGIADADVLRMTQRQFDRTLTTLAAQRRFPSEGVAGAEKIRREMRWLGKRIEIVE